MILIRHQHSSSLQGISNTTSSKQQTQQQQQQQQQDLHDHSSNPPTQMHLIHEYCTSNNETLISYNNRNSSRWQNCNDHGDIVQQHFHLHQYLPNSTNRRMRSTSNFVNSKMLRSSGARTQGFMCMRSSIPAMIISLVMMMVIIIHNKEKNIFFSDATRPTLVRQSHQSFDNVLHRDRVDIPHGTRRRLQQPLNPDRRTILVVRILDTPEDSATTLDRHNTIREVLFNGGSDASTMPSVQQQMKDCSGNAIIFIPQSIPETNDGNFIVDIVVNPSRITNQSNRDEWVEVMASIACHPDTGPLRNLIGTGNNDNVFNLEPDDDLYYTSILRQVADHIIIILPNIYPVVDFLATAEIDNRISIYAVSWGTSLSTYMHELAHNLGLRHSGDTIYSDIELDTEYGDNSGYMGESMITPWTPQKCYNAAHHWQLGWFGGINNNDGSVTASFRLSLSDTATNAPSLPLRINVAAFVDYMKLVQNTYDESFVILIQVTDNVYLQYNGAKAYNIGTDYAYANRIVIIEQDSDILSTSVLAALQAGDSYATPNSNRVIQVCDILISDADSSSDVIDFATIAISDSHTTSTVTSVCQDGPDYAPESLPMVVATSTPTEPPTANTIINIPSMAPVVTEISPAPTANVVEETPFPSSVPTGRVQDDANIDVIIDETLQPTQAPSIADIEEDDDTSNMLTPSPSKPSNLRGPVIVDNSNHTNTIASTNESPAENGLSTSSIIYSVFGTVMGAIFISIVVLFFLTRYSKETSEQSNVTNVNRTRPSTRPKRAGSRSKHQNEQPYGVPNGSSRTMKLPDGSPTSRRSVQEQCTKDNFEERSKSTVPSATTRSSSHQKPKIVLEKEKVPAVIIKNQNDDNDESSDDDDQSDTLSVILQKEIWKDRVHKILQSVMFVQDRDGTVTQMMPAATKASDEARQYEAGTKS